MRCSYCGRETGTSTGYCKACGRRLRPAHRPVQSGTRDMRQGSAQNRVQRSAAGSAGRRSVSQTQRGKTPQKKRKKTRWNPKFLAACAILLLILILIPVLIAVGVHRHSDTLQSNRIQMFYSGTSGKTSVVYAGKKQEKVIVGEVQETHCSADGRTQAVLTKDGALYYITTDVLDAVASDVVGFVLSADGGKLAYTVRKAPESTDTTDLTGTGDTTEAAETESEKQTMRSSLLETTEAETTEYVPAGGEKFLDCADISLFCYNGLDGSSSLIANRVEPSSVSLTPLGGGVCYTAASAEGDSFEGFYSAGGVNTSLGRNMLPIAVSEDGLIRYYVKYEMLDEVWVLKLFRKSGEEEVKLGEYADGNKLSVYFNRDFSEIVFGLDGAYGNYFWCGAEGERKKISTGFSPVYSYGVHEVYNGNSVIAPADVFARFVFCDNRGTAMYVDGKYECTDTGADGTFFRMSPDVKNIYYLDDKKTLYVCSLRKNERTAIAENILNFDLSADGGIVYYVNADNELHCRAGNKDTLAAENVYTKGTGMCVTDGGYLYFLQNYAYGNGTLCYMKEDGKVHVLDEVNNVHDIAADMGEYIYYRSDYGTISGTYDLYYGKEKKYTLLFEAMG